MEARLRDYLVQKIINDYRKKTIDPEILDIVSVEQYSEALRDLIEEGDKDLILDYLINHEDPRARTFTGMIMRPLLPVFVVEDLWGYWEKIDNPKEKDYFMYVLGDIIDLEQSYHEQLFEYLKANLEISLELKRGFTEPENALASLLAKINGLTRHPVSKKWIYWMNVLAFTDVISDEQLDRFIGTMDTSCVANVNRHFYEGVKNFVVSQLPA